MLAISVWACLINAILLTRVSAGNRSAAKMAMMAMTTNNSMSVKAQRERRDVEVEVFIDFEGNRPEIMNDE